MILKILLLIIFNLLYLSNEGLTINNQSMINTINNDIFFKSYKTHHLSNYLYEENRPLNSKKLYDKGDFLLEFKSNKLLFFFLIYRSIIIVSLISFFIFFNKLNSYWFLRLLIVFLIFIFFLKSSSLWFYKKFLYNHDIDYLDFLMESKVFFKNLWLWIINAIVLAINVFLYIKINEERENSANNCIILVIVDIVAILFELIIIFSFTNIKFFTTYKIQYQDTKYKQYKYYYEFNEEFITLLKNYKKIYPKFQFKLNQKNFGIKSMDILLKKNIEEINFYYSSDKLIDENYNN